MDAERLGPCGELLGDDGRTARIFAHESSPDVVLEDRGRVLDRRHRDRSAGVSSRLHGGFDVHDRRQRRLDELRFAFATELAQAERPAKQGVGELNAGEGERGAETSRDSRAEPAAYPLRPARDMDVLPQDQRRRHDERQDDDGPQDLRGMPDQRVCGADDDRRRKPGHHDRPCRTTELSPADG